MADKKLETARELIEDGHYDAARGLLETMPQDPTAQRWLKQLDTYQGSKQPAPPPAAPPVRTVYVERERSLPWAWIISILLIVVVVGGIAFAIYSRNEQAQRAASEYVCGLTYQRYSTQWQNCVDDR